MTHSLHVHSLSKVFIKGLTGTGLFQARGSYNEQKNPFSPEACIIMDLSFYSTLSFLCHIYIHIIY